MNMTHYMELLATNQPWHLILFMAVPVILAETVAITELFILLRRLRAGPLVLESADSTLIVPPGFTAAAGPAGTILATHEEPRR